MKKLIDENPSLTYLKCAKLILADLAHTVHDPVVSAAVRARAVLGIVNYCGSSEEEFMKFDEVLYHLFYDMANAPCEEIQMAIPNLIAKPHPFLESRFLKRFLRRTAEHTNMCLKGCGSFAEEINPLVRKFGCFEDSHPIYNELARLTSIKKVA